MLLTILLSLAGVASFVLLMSVGLLFKGKALEGTCASQSKLLNEDGMCGFCGKEVGTCENDPKKEKLALS